LLATALLATERHHATQRRANRTAMIRSLCARADVSAPELAIALALPMPVVAPLLRQLMAEGLILESRARSTDNGRVLPRYRLDPAHLALLGADVGVDRVRVVASSLSGRVLASTTLAYGKARSTMTCIDSLASASLRVCRSLGVEARHVVGMGIGLPSAQDPPTGDSHAGSPLRTRDIPFGSLLARDLEGSPLEGLPLFPGTAADVAALGEFEFGPLVDGPASLLYLSLEEELHAGIVIDGELVTGRQRCAGGVGHTILQVDGPRCSCGRSGCAEALIGSRSLLGTADPDPVKALRRRLDAGSPDTLSAVARAGEHLGTLLHNLAILYRPSRIVVGGSMIALGDALLEPARRALGAGGFALHGRHAALSPSHFGADAIAVGAAALARHHLCGRLDGAMPCALRRSEAIRRRTLFSKGDLAIYQVRGGAQAVGP